MSKVIRCKTPAGFEIDVNPIYNDAIVRILAPSDVRSVSIRRAMGTFTYYLVEEE